MKLQNDFINLLLLFGAALCCLGCINLTPKRPALWVVSLLFGMACFGLAGLMPYLPDGRPHASTVMAVGLSGMMLGVFITYYRSTERTLAYSVRKMALQSMVFGVVIVLFLAIPIGVYFPSRERIERITYLTLLQMQRSIEENDARSERRYREMSERLAKSDAAANARDSAYRVQTTRNQHRIINTQEQVRRDLKKSQNEAAKQPKVIIVRPPKIGNRSAQEYLWHDGEPDQYRAVNW